MLPNFRFNRQYGFTLIELIVVVLIVGITAPIAVSSLRNSRDRMLFNAAVEEIKGELITAQSQAIRDSDQRIVAFDIGATTTDVETQDSLGAVIRSIDFGDDVSISAHGFTASNGLAFSFKGTSPNSADFVSITHTRNANLTACVGIANMLGRVYEGEFSGGSCNE